MKGMLANLTTAELTQLQSNASRFDPMLVCSMCSGSEMQEAIGLTLMKVLVGKPRNWATRWSCENNAANQKWLHNIVNKDKPQCIFTSLDDLCVEPLER